MICSKPEVLKGCGMMVACQFKCEGGSGDLVDLELFPIFI